MSNLKIGENIKAKRKELDFTQEELANVLGVTKAAVSKWENAESYPDITILPKISGLFHVTIDELLGYEPYNHEPETPIIINKYTSGFALDDLEDYAVLDHGTIENVSMFKGYRGYNVIGEIIPDDKWIVAVCMTSTEDDFPYILQKCIKPNRLRDMYSYRYIDDKAIDDDKPNKHYVCKKKVWEYKNTDLKYLKQMLKEQVEMGFIEEE